MQWLRKAKPHFSYTHDRRRRMHGLLLLRRTTLPPLTLPVGRFSSANRSSASTTTGHHRRGTITMASVVQNVEPLSFPFQTPDPFLFAVYHNDAYPAGDEKMQAPKKGNGADFDPSAPYRMYHGSRVPGFPQHPHRGFETITSTMKGIIDHTDSMGNAGRYGHGDVQWMTAGRGIVHGEMFPLVNNDKPNNLQLFQIWLNLPGKRKMSPPAFTMHWIESFNSDDGRTSIVVWAGELMGAKGRPPPPASWASDPSNEVGVWFITARPGAALTLPPAAGGRNVNRTLYFFDGDVASVGSKTLTRHSAVTLDASQPAEIAVPSSAGKDTLLLVLQGKPINEPVAQHGPFVMNSKQEIMQAFSDYQETQFGGWPWPEDAVVFPRDKGRFALVDGKEEQPPSDGGGRQHDEM